MRARGFGCVGTALFCCLAMAPQAGAEVTEEMEARFVSTLKHGVRSGDFQARATAVAGLGHVPREHREEALELVREALEDPQWQVRKGAIEALLALGDRTWKKALVDAVRAQRLDPSEEVLPLLEPLGTAKAVAVLKEGLSGEEVPNARKWADALAERGGELMVEAYAAALRSPSAEVKGAFAERLPDLPLPDAAPLYQRYLHDQPGAIQLRVIERVATGGGDDDTGFLKRLLRAKDADVQLRAAAAMARRGDDAGRSILVEAARGDERERRLWALRALEGIATEALFDIAKPIVMDPEADIESLEAAYAIYAKVGHPNLAKHLRKRLMSTDIERRAAAVRILGEIEGRDALSTLHELLGDGSALVRKQAARAIGGLGRVESVEPLRRKADNESDPQVRLAILEALGAIRSPEIVPVLQQFIYEPEDEVRVTVLEALKAVHHPSAAPVLELLLRDRSMAIRRGALLALLDLGPGDRLSTFQDARSWIPPESLPELARQHGEAMRPHLELALSAGRDDLREAALDSLEALPEGARVEIYERLARKARHTDMRVAGIRGLAATQGKQAVELLAELTDKDEERQVRVAAIDALGRLGADGLAGRLFELTDDLHEQVRVAAAAALARL